MASKRLKDLEESVQVCAENHIELCADEGITLLIYCTYRSDKEQAIEYAKGRTAPGKIVTYAKPGQSKHNNTDDANRPASLAYDCVPLVNGKAAWNDKKLYERVGVLGEKAGMSWAGRWTKFKEFPHFERKEKP